MSDVVFKASQLGYDVKTAADSQLLFNSAWPLLKIAYEGDYIINSTATQTIYAHNLNYPAAFFICDYSSGQSTTTPSLNNDIYCNNEQLFYKQNLFPAYSLPVKIHFYIFLLDLTKEFTGSIINQSFQTPGSRVDDVVLKVTKPGKDVTSTDLRDFTLHSGTQSPLIHQVANKIQPSVSISGSNSVIAAHNLGYYPLFFPFVSDGNGNYKFSGNYTQSTPRVFGTTSSTELVLGNSSKAATLVIFKDPYSVDIPNIVVQA